MTAKHSNATGKVFSQCGLKTAIKKFGKLAEEAGMKEVKQPHNRVLLQPMHWNKLMPEECKQAIESLMHVKQKRTRECKGHTCADGRPMRATAKPEDTVCPTAFLESILPTAVTEAEERRDVMTLDTSNSFVQTELE